MTHSSSPVVPEALIEDYQRLNAQSQHLMAANLIGAYVQSDAFQGKDDEAAMLGNLWQHAINRIPLPELGAPDIYDAYKAELARSDYASAARKIIGHIQSDRFRSTAAEILAVQGMWQKATGPMQEGTRKVYLDFAKKSRKVEEVLMRKVTERNVEVFRKRQKQIAHYMVKLAVKAKATQKTIHDVAAERVIAKGMPQGMDALVEYLVQQNPAACDALVMACGRALLWRKEDSHASTPGINARLDQYARLLANNNLDNVERPGRALALRGARHFFRHAGTNAQDALYERTQKTVVQLRGQATDEWDALLGRSQNIGMSPVRRMMYGVGRVARWIIEP